MTRSRLPYNESRSGNLRPLIAGFLLACALAASAPVAQAQNIQPSEEYDRAFQAMLSDPGNLDKTFAYADAAIKAGDLEGAVAALERMLFVNPNLPRIRLELGVLYFRLGSYEAARSYLNSAVEAPDTPPEVRAKVESFLAEIDKRKTPHKWSGSLFAGLRWQSNANTASATGNVVVGGFSAVLDSQFTQKRDWNSFAALNLKHSYEMSEASADTWDTTMVTYIARQFRQETVDVSLAEITTGPNYKLMPGTDLDPTFRPYALLSYVAIDDVRDFFAPGIGASLGLTLTPQLLFETSGELRDRRFRDSFKSPNKSDRDGLERSLRTRLLYAIDQDWSLNAGASLVKQETELDTQGNLEYAFTFGATYNFDAPFKLTSQRWSAIASVTRAMTAYDEPDPTVDPNVTRFDKDWRISLTQAISLTQSWTLVGVLSRTLRGSSLPNNQYTNDSVMFGASIRF